MNDAPVPTAADPEPMVIEPQLDSHKIQIIAPADVDVVELARYIGEQIAARGDSRGVLITSPYPHVDEIPAATRDHDNDYPDGLPADTLVADGAWRTPSDQFYQTDDVELPPIVGELASLLNRYSAESPSGTPDYILADFLIGVLREFNEAVSRRAEWRDESVELPALQRQDIAARRGGIEFTEGPFKPPFSGMGLDPAQVIGELAGAASVCWNPMPSGEFESEQASRLVEDAILAVEQHYSADVVTDEKCSPEREDIDEGPMLVAGKVQTLWQPGHKRAAKLLKKAAVAVDAGNIDVAEQFRKLAEVRLQWGVK